MTDRITTRDLEGMLGRYVRACETLALIPNGHSVALTHGSKVNGIAYRVALVRTCEHPTGTLIDPTDHSEGTRCDTCAARLPANGVPLNDDAERSRGNERGHHNPPAGRDFLGMTRREAYDSLYNRATTLEDAAYAQKMANR